MRLFHRPVWCIIILFNSWASLGQTVTAPVESFQKIDTLLPMRDGKMLYTVIYIPRDTNQSYPILMQRTPYSAGPYGNQNYPASPGSNHKLLYSGYILVFQDVRGRYMSEGVHLEVTPHLQMKTSGQMVDESSDTYDTIEFLLKMLKNHNGRVGLRGISYPGFYASAALPQAHPALKAVSPQAPVTDEFIGDDVNHNGAFFLMDNFSFMNYFGAPRSGPVMDYTKPVFDTTFDDAYRFFLELGPLSNTQTKSLFDHKSYIWDEYLAHDTYDDYWQARNIRPFLKNITIPTLVVGGWFDAEDCFGTLKTYQAIETQSSGNSNFLVVGPWTHGAWASKEWSHWGPYRFDQNTSIYFQDSIETPFFDHFLKDKGRYGMPEAKVFETGSNLWKSYNHWPPMELNQKSYYLTKEGTLSGVKSKKNKAYQSYISDPTHPVPYSSKTDEHRNNLYMVEDQRFASSRPDVLSWTSEPLDRNMLCSGPVSAEIWVSTSGTDMDLVVKVIDEVPKDAGENAGAQLLVRAEVIRGKFRNDYVHPEPFKPNIASLIKYTLPDINHLFKKGHKVMIQVQSSWFPLVDRNPHQFINIPTAQASDYKKAEIRIYSDKKHPSKIEMGEVK